MHRGGVLAATILSGTLGLSFFAGLIAYRASPGDFNFKSSDQAGMTMYGWVVGIEILILVIGGFSRISQTIAGERRSGLWDSNRLTPLRPAELIRGYWFGSGLREAYMAAVLAAWGLGIVLVAGLPMQIWLLTQSLTISSALFFGLLGVLAGLCGDQPRGGWVILLVLSIALSQMFIEYAPKHMIINYIFPTYPIIWVFSGWRGEPSLPGFRINPVILSLSVQLSLGVFLWRAAVRKTANAFLSMLGRWEAVTFYCVILLFQYALIWSVWRGEFGHCRPIEHFDQGGLLPIIQSCMMLLGILLLVAVEVPNAWTRRMALNAGTPRMRTVLSVSAVLPATALAAAAGIAILTQCVFSFVFVWKMYLSAVGNMLTFFLTFVLLLEYCRLRFGRHALGFFMLWLFVLCALPFILSAIFFNSAIARLSLLSPGIAALSDPISRWSNFSLLTVLAHFGIVGLLFMMWYRQWNKMLEEATFSASHEPS